ncbi:S1C family serine protease [Microbacterium sp.]|uniref:S1C family serine protease n=1 Tax=Microbacterium sp. TaxID=51671 RepID=UPI0037C5198D
MTDTQGTNPTDDSAQSNGDATPASEHTPTAPDAPTVPPHTAPAASAHNGYPPPPPQPRAHQPPTPVAPPAPPAHPGAPSGGQAFGPAAYGAHATGTQPTLPFGPGPVGAAPHTPQKKSAAGRVAGLIVAAALVGGAAGLGGAYAGTQLWGTPSTTVVQSGSTVTVNNPDKVNATTAIAAKVTPSVVTIEVSGGGSGGSGSGVLLSEDGYVATNTHVVTLDGATGTPAIRVTTSDGKIYDAEIVGTDPTYDLAVIKLEDASGLTPIEFADSSELNVGDQTVAIGAPLGLSNTVTTGIVSALNRSISIASSAAPESSTDEDQGEQDEEEGQQGPFQFDIPGRDSRGSGSAGTISIAVIQTDAAINPGNSGGALVDAEGKLIGINVAIATAGSSMSDSSGSIGVGFSIPSNIVERVTDEIIADGAATHGLLGASVVAASSVEDATISGAYIQEISSGGAADAAGIREGDIVTAFNGVPITDSIDLTAQVRAAAAGSDATVTFVRDGETQSVDVTLGSLG